jgi:hypothetical protein
MRVGGTCAYKRERKKQEDVCQEGGRRAAMKSARSVGTCLKATPTTGVNRPCKTIPRGFTSAILFY